MIVGVGYDHDQFLLSDFYTECAGKFIFGSYLKLLVWCMKFKKALNMEKNTPIVRKDEIGLQLKLIITSFNIRLLTLRKSVAS